MAADNPTAGLGHFTLRAAILLLLVVLGIGAWALREVLLLAFLSVILAIVMQVPVRRLERLGLSRGLGMMVTLLGMIAFFVTVGAMTVSVFVTQSQELLDQLPDAFDQAREEYEKQSDRHDWLPDVDWDGLTEGDFTDFVMEQAGRLSQNLFPFLSGLGGVVANLVFVLFITLFFLGDPPNFMAGALSLVPINYRPRALEIFSTLGETIRRWFVGQIISMLMLGSMIWVVDDFILGLPSPFALGVIAGVMEFIPNFGATISLIPAVLVALAKDPGLVPWVLLAYIVTQQIQSNVIMPRIMARQIEIPAATLLIAQLIFAALFGFLGLLLAVPLTVVVLVFVRELYVRDGLNSRTVRIEHHVTPEGATYPVVVTQDYRPRDLTPGQAAELYAQGVDPFRYGDREIVEIVTPVTPAMEQSARSQQVVWAALLALVVGQALALVRSLLRDD